MQTFISLLVILPILAATSLKIIPQTNQQTYAEYAQENGIAIALTKSNLKADYQYLDCYDNFGQGGQSLRVSDYISDLRSSGFDNRFSSCCFYGIWTLYQSNSYNGNNAQVSCTLASSRSWELQYVNVLHKLFQGAAYNAWGENYCTDLQGNPTFDNQASSVRYTFKIGSYPTRQTDRSLICVWYENLIGIWYAFRSVYGSNSDQKPPYSPIKFFFQHIKLQSNFFFWYFSLFWYENSNFFKVNLIWNEVNLIWNFEFNLVWNFEVNLISVSPLKNLFFIIFLKSRGWCGHLYRIPILTSSPNTIE
jgi:hypothetical protein